MGSILYPVRYAAPRVKGWALPAVDGSHPLAQGLKFAIWTAGAEAVDLVTGAVAVTNEALGPITSTITAYGPAAEFSGSGGVLTVPHQPDFALTDELSLAWWGELDTVSAAAQMLAGKSAGSGTSGTPFVLSVTSTPNQRVRLTRSNSTFRIWGTTTPPPVDAPTLVSVSAPALIEDQPAFYIDGVAAAPAMTTNGTAIGAATDVGAAIHIGRQSSMNWMLDGRVSLVLGWARQLSADEHRLLAANPLRMLTYPRRWVPVRVDQQGDVALSGAAALSVLGQRVQAGAAALTGAAALAGVATRTQPAALALSGGAGVSAAGLRVIYHALGVSGAAALAGTGILIRPGALHATATASLGASARVVRRAAASLTATAALALGPDIIRVSALHLPSAGAITVSPALIRSAAATLAGAAAMTGGGDMIYVGRGALVGDSAFAAAGIVPSRPGLRVDRPGLRSLTPLHTIKRAR